MTLSFKQVEKLARKDSMESKVEQSLVSSLQPDIQLQVRSSINAHDSPVQVIKDGLVQRPDEQLAACLQELNHKMVENNELASRIIDLVSKNNELACKNNDLASKNNNLTSAIMDLVTKNNELASNNSTMASDNNELMTRMVHLQESLDAKQDEMRNLQLQALDRLALLQNNVKALLTQNYELHEYPIPRLFIVLPEDTSSWNPMDLFANKFRLYFLCECGEHTQSSNSKIPHHIHLAKHEGYDIARPNEFFQRYGSYVLTILRMLKFGISAAGIAVPTASLLIRDDSIAKASSSLKMLIGSIQSGMDQAIGYIEKISPNDNDAGIRPLDQMKNNEALEGADLRQLESFLRSNDETRVLGNLYRTVTSKGHVKWVCIDHYRENYHEKAAKAFRDVVEALKGTFDENIGRVQVTLQSRVQAEQFYSALEKSRSVYELGIKLDWEVTLSDFKNLRDTLVLTNVGVLQIYLGQHGESTRDRLNRSQRYDPLLDIMRHRSIQSVTVRGPCNFTKRSSLSSHNYDFSNLRHLDISLEQLTNDTLGVNCLIAKAPNLPSLALGTNTGYTIEELRGGNDYLVQAYNAIAEHQTCPIIFKEWNLRISPLPREPNRSIDAHQCREHLFQDYWESTSKVGLDGDTLGSPALDALAKTTAGFKRLRLSQEGLLGKKFINNLSSIVCRSELSMIIFNTYDDKGRVRILESIQWKYLRTLCIHMTPGTFETSVMRALVDGVMKMLEKVQLEGLVFWAEAGNDGPLTLPEGDLLQSFVASTSIERLELCVDMTLEQMLSFLKTADFSRMHHLELWAFGFSSVQVDAILDGLQHATKLEELFLLYANITDEQISRMEVKGVSLSMYAF